MGSVKNFQAEGAVPRKRGSGQPRHRRNPRGEGGRLTEEIVSGALAIIDREGSDGVTLRAVAREIGIAAPSIYAHFQDREGIMLAVVARVFDELTMAISVERSRAGDDPVERLVAGCEAYVAFGVTNPARYSVLFSDHRSPGDDAWRQYCKPVTLMDSGAPVLEFGSECFALLMDSLAVCVAAGRSSSTDVFADSTAIWVALHGTVSLKSATPGFPWPHPDDLVRGFVLLLGRIS